MDKINYLYNAIVKHLNNKWICHDDNETQVINENSKIDNKFKKLPYELKNIIFEYDGHIEYRYKKKKQSRTSKFIYLI